MGTLTPAQKRERHVDALTLAEDIFEDLQEDLQNIYVKVAKCEEDVARKRKAFIDAEAKLDRARDAHDKCAVMVENQINQIEFLKQLIDAHDETEVQGV